MDGHEWPYLVKNNMFGWEKALTRRPHITENGAALFTPQSESLEKPF